MQSHAQETVLALERTARRVLTPAGKGSMVWRIWGEGPDLVLLHGGHGSWRHWIRNIPDLARRHRVIVPDLPGMGDSAPAGDGRSMEPLAAAVAAGIDRLGIADRYLLGGFSFGSLVAGYMLAHHPARVRHLLMVGSTALGPFDDQSGRLRRWQPEPDPARRMAVHRHNLSVLMLHDPVRVDDLAVLVQAHNAERTAVNYTAAALGADLPARLAPHPVPITGIWGAEDVLVRNHFAAPRAFLAGRRPPGRFLMVPGAGHWVQYEAPAATNALMLEALEGAVA